MTSINDTGIFFLLKPGGIWERYDPRVSLRNLYQASIVLKLNKDGTGTVLKNRYTNEPRLSETWTKDEMLIVALQSASP